MNIQHHLVQVFGAEFHPDKNINMESAGKLPFMPLSEVLPYHCTDVH
jgi:hypothetical protein